MWHHFPKCNVIILILPVFHQFLDVGVLDPVFGFVHPPDIVFFTDMLFYDAFERGVDPLLHKHVRLGAQAFQFRKLLLHRRQIDSLDGRLRQKGLALVPLELYFDEHNRVKLQLGVGRGKKLYDKRADMAKRQSDLDIRRALKERNR